MDFQSEWDENWLELMAKGIRTQPTSRNPIPTSQTSISYIFVFHVLGFSSVLNLKPCFSNSTWTVFDGTRLDRCGLKSECERFEYDTNLMARKFKKVELSIFHQRIIDFRHPGIQASRHTGIQASWHPGKLASRHPGIQASKHPSIQASRHPGIQEIDTPLS